MTSPWPAPAPSSPAIGSAYDKVVHALSDRGVGTSWRRRLALSRMLSVGTDHPVPAQAVRALVAQLGTAGNHPDVTIAACNLIEALMSKAAPSRPDIALIARASIPSLRSLALSQDARLAATARSCLAAIVTSIRDDLGASLLLWMVRQTDPVGRVGVACAASVVDRWPDRLFVSYRDQLQDASDDMSSRSSSTTVRRLARRLQHVVQARTGRCAPVAPNAIDTIQAALIAIRDARHRRRPGLGVSIDVAICQVYASVKVARRVDGEQGVVQQRHVVASSWCVRQVVERATAAIGALLNGFGLTLSCDLVIDEWCAVKIQV